MYAKSKLAVWTAMLVCIPAISRAEETIESIEKQIVQATADIKSMSAKINIDGQMEQMGQSMTMSGDGLVEAMIDGETEKSRTEMNMKITMGSGESAMKIDTSSVTVVDGEFAYVLQDQMGQKMAFKTKAEKSNTPTMGGAHMFKTLRENNDLRVLPDSDVDGRETFVIEATPREKPPMMPIKNMLIYIDKKHGMNIKTVINNTSGSPMQSMTLSDVKVNPKIEPSRFVFKAPEGVTVMDQSNM